MKKNERIADTVSLTAYRVIAIFNMLKNSPCTDNEISNALNDDTSLSRLLSKDSIWLYINTLKAIGCQVSRPTKINDYKYILKDHPFKINLTISEVKTLINIRKYINNLSDWRLSCNYDKFISAVCHLLDDETKDSIANINKHLIREVSYLDKCDLLVEIDKYCKKRASILIKYVSPSGNVYEINFLADFLKYENGAIYLWGYNLDTGDMQYLRVDRINSVKKIDIKNDSLIIKTPTTAKYKLFGVIVASHTPDEDERIIDEDDNSITVEANIKNKFKFFQKIMSFGDNCVILEPEELREELVKKLKLMSDIYK